jgi:mannose-6-phosphate isomerase class I
MPPEWRGTRLASRDDFPILVKFIFPKDKLSIQVHPDDAYAAAHEQAAGGRGKTCSERGQSHSRSGACES